MWTSATAVQAVLVHHFDLLSTGTGRREHGNSRLLVQLGTPFDKNVYLRSAVHRIFALETFPEIKTFIATFLGQLSRSVGWRFLVYGAV